MHLTPTHPAQTFLFFIPELEARVRHELWESKHKKVRKISVSGQHKSSVQLDLLDLPLFRTRLDDDVFNGEVEERFFPVESSFEMKSCVPEEIDWSDSDVIELHLYLLSRSLIRLEAAGGREEKLEILKWIFNSPLPDQVERQIDGELQQILIPFTFSTCCRLEGADPDEMRELLKHHCHKLGMLIH